MTAFVDGKSEAYVEPHRLGAADDLERVTAKFVAGTRTRLDTAVREFEFTGVGQVVINTASRGGVPVQLLAV
jgi:hypothetical protein